MKWKLRLRLEDVYGGYGEVRYEPQEQVKLSRSRTKVTLRESIGVAIPVTTEEQIKESKLEPISTFRLDEDGTPLLRLGGAHGKLWRALKSAARQLYELGDDSFKKSYKAAVAMVTVSPVWVRLETDEDLRVEGIPQLLRGTGGGMIIQHFDVIPRADATVFLTFPEALAGKVRRMLAQLELGSHFNKRRTSIKIEDVTSTDQPRPDRTVPDSAVPS